MKKRSKFAAVFAFLLMLLFWVLTVSHDSLGFRPVMGTSGNPAGENIGSDIVSLLIWILFLYSVWNLYLAFKKNFAAKPR
jgi:hypothetical protein